MSAENTLRFTNGPSNYRYGDDSREKKNENFTPQNDVSPPVYHRARSSNAGGGIVRSASSTAQQFKRKSGGSTS